MKLEPIDYSDFVEVSSLEELATSRHDLAMLVHEDGASRHEITRTTLATGENLFGNSEKPSILQGSRQFRRTNLRSFSLKNVVFFQDLSLLLTEDGRYVPDTFGYIPQWGDTNKVDKAFTRNGDIFEVDDDVLKGVRRNQVIYGLSISPSTIARQNYGHFMFDGLSAGWFQFRNLIHLSPRVIVPLMQPWHKEIYTLLGMGHALHHIGKPVLLERAITSSQVAGHLQSPARIVRTVFDELRLKCATDNSAPKKIYIRRSPGSKRDIRNRAEFERILADRNFHVFEPEKYSVAEQVRIVGRADVIVGQGGAGMNNVLFAPFGAQVLEIIPDAYEDAWIRVSCELIGGKWNGLYCKVNEGDIGIGKNPLWPGSKDFAFDVPIDQLVLALDTIERRTG